MSGGEVFLDTAVTANLARLHSYGTTRVLKNARYEAAVPYPTMARLMFGNGQIETVKHLVDVPTELEQNTFLAEQNTPLAQEQKSLGGAIRFPIQSIVSSEIRRRPRFARPLRGPLCFRRGGLCRGDAPSPPDGSLRMHGAPSERQIIRDSYPRRG